MRARAFIRAFSKALLKSRRLTPMDAENSHTPFTYDIHALSNLRPDQVPRLLGALTHPERLPKRKVNLSQLFAIQNRVNTKKVEAIRQKGVHESPVVVHMHDRDYILDGHHRAAADWLNGKTSIRVHYKDLSEFDNSVKSARSRSHD